MVSSRGAGGATSTSTITAPKPTADANEMVAVSQNAKNRILHLIIAQSPTSQHDT
jgi:hypothetical protein